MIQNWSPGKTVWGRLRRDKRGLDCDFAIRKQRTSLLAFLSFISLSLFPELWAESKSSKKKRSRRLVPCKVCGRDDF